MANSPTTNLHPVNETCAPIAVLETFCECDYSEEKAFSDHAITIVGWDDTYSKDNFKLPNGHTPEHDGAYIGLNSWGSGFGDGGYFYISYDDTNIEDEMNGVIYTSLDSEGYVDVTKLNNNLPNKFSMS